MADREFKLTDGLRGHPMQPLLDRSEETETQSAPALQREPVDQVTCRAGDASCATAHASTLNRATASQPARAGRSLLQLQKQYGNRYVDRVLAIARQGTEHSDVSTDVERAIDQRRGGGQPLDSGVRRQMEPAFGADFGGVRVHTDSQADTLNRALSARAFTTGQDIFFRESAYQPGSSAGRELLAHELTHVVQQNGEGLRPKLTVSQPGDQHEVEADAMARAVMQREQQAAPDSGSGLARHVVDEAQRQPEAVKNEEEEKKKRGLMAKTEESSLARQAPSDKEEDKHAMTQRNLAEVHRQPEAVKNEEEEKRKRGLMTKTDVSRLTRQAEEAGGSESGLEMR
jgi:hypothetical protein